MEKILLIDGNSVLFRAYYATSHGMIMATSDGIYTNAIFGFANMFNKVIQMLEPKYCIVAFDKGKHNFRHNLSADYKGTRKPAPHELVGQFALVREYLKASNVPYVEVDEIEADDIIGSYAKHFKDVEVNILTSDRDLLQTIDTNVKVILMKKGITDLNEMTLDNLNTLYDLRPLQIIDLKGLMGDTADNIKGVKGIGEKGAIKLLKQFDTVEGIYEHIDEIKGKVKTLLEEQKDSALLSKKLATIKTDVPLDCNIDDYVLNIDYKGMKAFYLKYQMKSLASRIDIPVEEVLENNENKEYEIVSKINPDLFKDKSCVYFDTNTFEYLNPELLGLGISNGIINQYISVDDLLNDQALLDYLASDSLKIVYDAKFLYHIFKKYNLKVNNIFDLKVSLFVYDSSISDYEKLLHAFNLESKLSINDVYGTINKPKMPLIDEQRDYSLDFANNMLKSYDEIIDKIEEQGLAHLLYDVEFPLTRVLYEMESNGVLVDLNTLDEISKNTQAKIDDLSKAIYEKAGHEFNINSPKQLQVVLFDELLLPVTPKRSTSQENLEEIMDADPIINDILQYRKYAKLYSTYAEGLKKYVQADGKLHTIYNQCATLTGRLSSTEPNLQNISVRDEETKEIRKAFLPSKDNLLVSLDYSQIELRILAHMANEEKMIEAFKHNVDIHTSTASRIFNVPVEEVDSNLRRRAKAVNFGVVYGISEFGLAKQVGTSFRQAKQFIDSYFTSYPNIKAYLDNVIKECEELGYVKTILNRRRYINEIKASNRNVKEFGKRAAMNSPIQGSAADLIKIAMVNIEKALNNSNLKTKMILQVHDELIFDCPKDELDLVINLVKKEMENAMDLNVPLLAEVNYGETWFDMK